MPTEAQAGTGTLARIAALEEHTRSLEGKVRCVQGRLRAANVLVAIVLLAGLSGTAGALAQDASPLVTNSVDFTPVGTVVPFAGAEVPKGWLEADGTLVGTPPYGELCQVLGDTYSRPGDPASLTSCRLPDLRGRVAVGVDGDAGRLSQDDALGASGGVATLTADEMPRHSHGPGDLETDATPNHEHPLLGRTPIILEGWGTFDVGTAQSGCCATGFPVGPNVYKYTHADWTGSAGSHTHRLARGNTSSAGAGRTSGNLQPYQALTYIIRALPTVPRVGSE